MSQSSIIITPPLRAPVITVDGPSGAGKGTLAKELARQLGYRLLDSGALYRLTALSARRNGVDYSDVAAVAKLAVALNVEFLGDIVLLDGDDVTKEIRTELSGEGASKVAVIPDVRTALNQRQRTFGGDSGLVADGRDMGTAIFPEAPVKIFLTASAEARAERRARQLKDMGEGANIAQILSDIKIRDDRDMNRAVNPLRPAGDARQLDSTSLTITQVIDQALNFVERTLGVKKQS